MIYSFPKTWFEYFKLPTYNNFGPDPRKDMQTLPLQILQTHCASFIEMRSKLMGGVCITLVGKNSIYITLCINYYSMNDLSTHICQIISNF